MAKIEQKSLTLIMARELAANLATPIFIVDNEGDLVFYNEPAESILGMRYADAGELKAAEWAAMWTPTDMNGTRLALEGLPLGVALQHKRPAYQRLRITDAEGTQRTIDVSAFPLFALQDEFSGAMAVFWEDDQTS